MAVDIQCVSPQETIRVDKVLAVPNTSPTVLQVFGEDFRAVDSVEINEIAATLFSISSKTELFVTLPSGVRSPRDVRSVTVTSKRLVLTSRSFFRFRIGKIPGKVSGILKLSQLFVKILFTTPGSDIFSQNVGGAGLKNIGRSFSSAQSGSIVSDFIVAVQTAARQIVGIQSQKPGLPADEKLLNAKVTASTFSSQEAALQVTVELLSQSGESALVNLVV